MGPALIALGIVLGVCWYLAVPLTIRWALVTGFFAAGLGSSFLLGATSPLGGSVAAWGSLILLIAAIAGYRWVLQTLKSRADTQAPEPADPDRMSDTELTRYARHIVLRELGGAGQQKLRNAKVLVVGAGGLGCPALLYLAAAGVGRIGVIDDDVVSLSNLQRQVLFRDADIDVPKVKAATDALRALNPHIDLRPYQRRLDDTIAEELFADYDLILDGTDNFATRDLVNRACVANKTPLISGAVAQWEGQVSLFAPHLDAPCYACLFPKEPADGQAPSCAEAGVIGALPGVIGTQMAAEAIKFISGAGVPLLGQMVVVDLLYSETRKITVQRNADCPVCEDA